MTAKRTLLITGTDTGVGKTFVACGLARALADRGIDTVAIKPVETGTGDQPSPEEDGVLLAEATGQAAPREALTRLGTPVAPPVAADREGVELDLEQWSRAIEKYSKKADVTLVEGAGGFLSPLTWKASSRVLGNRIHARALLVVGNRLGCVNHTLLTIEALEQGRIPLIGVVLNTIDAQDESVETNLETIRKFIGVERLISLPRLAHWKEGAQHLAIAVDWVLK